MPTAIRASKYFIYDGTEEGATRVKDAVGRAAVYVSNMLTAGTSGPLYFTPDVGNIVDGSAVMYYVNGSDEEVYTDTWSADVFARDFIDVDTLSD